MTAERKILWIPIVAGTLLALNGIAGAIVTGSQAVLFDGLFSGAAAITGAVTLYALRLPDRSGHARCQRGYASYEPLVNIAKGFMMLGLLVYMAWESAVVISSGGKNVAFAGAIPFTIISAGTSLAAATFAWSQSRHAKSPLVRVEAMAWMLDALVMLGVMAALALAQVLSNNGLQKASAYIDPALAMALVLFTICTPYRLASDLLNRMPAEKELAPIERAVRSALPSASIRELNITPMRVGRFWQVLVHARLDRSAANFTAAAAVDFRRAVAAKLREVDERVSVDLLFLHLQFTNPPADDRSSDAGAP